MALNQKALTVSQLTSLIKGTLEEAFPAVWVAGEISNLSRPHSGHVYLTLKDEGAQIRAVLWKGTAAHLKFELADGLQVICHGELDVYPPRGSYQLVVRRMEPKGIGALQLAFAQLHARLAAEGLFDPARKRRLPRFPRRIALVTSPTGAAVRDFLEVLRRRWRGASVLVIPTRVQGSGAAAEIAAAIGRANALPEPPDVLVVGRGGGSLEDLWSFNEEPVVRAIFASRVPVVSAVGHEIDVTLADLAADVRALTPSEAAERVVPSGEELRRFLAAVEQRLKAGLRSRAAALRMRLAALARRRPFRRPFDLVHEPARRLDELEARLARAARGNLARARERLASLAARLETLSPLAVLGRGYSITLRPPDGEPLCGVAGLHVGEEILTRLARGTIVSRIESLQGAAGQEAPEGPEAG